MRARQAVNPTALNPKKQFNSKRTAVAPKHWVEHLLVNEAEYYEDGES